MLLQLALCSFWRKCLSVGGSKRRSELGQKIPPEYVFGGIALPTKLFAYIVDILGFARGGDLERSFDRADTWLHVQPLSAAVPAPSIVAAQRKKISSKMRMSAIWPMNSQTPNMNFL
jgi:hypothetical protein